MQSNPANAKAAKPGGSRPRPTSRRGRSDACGTSRHICVRLREVRLVRPMKDMAGGEAEHRGRLRALRPGAECEQSLVAVAKSAWQRRGPFASGLAAQAPADTLDATDEHEGDHRLDRQIDRPPHGCHTNS